MKHLIVIICLLLCTPAANAGWFTRGPTLLDEAKARITTLDQQLATQTESLNRWKIATGTLGVACVILLLIGTALGAQTRKHYDASRRLGTNSPPNIGLNGRKPHIVGKEAEEAASASLAA